MSVASNRLNQLNDATGHSNFHALAKVSLTCMSTDLLSFIILVMQRALLMQNEGFSLISGNFRCMLSSLMNRKEATRWLRGLPLIDEVDLQGDPETFPFLINTIQFIFHITAANKYAYLDKSARKIATASSSTALKPLESPLVIWSSQLWKAFPSYRQSFANFL